MDILEYSMEQIFILKFRVHLQVLLRQLAILRKDQVKPLKY